MMTSNKASENVTFSKILFVLCLLPLSELFRMIAVVVYTGDFWYVFLTDFFCRLSTMLSLVAFLLVNQKRKTALIISAIATLLSLFAILSSIFWGASLQLHYLIPCILLTIYCFNPKQTKAWLFAGISGSLLVVLHIITIFEATYYSDFTSTIIFYMLGFLSQSNIAVQNVEPQKKKKDTALALNQLERFAQLKDQGILTAEEFENKKQELMNQI